MPSAKIKKSPRYHKSVRGDKISRKRKGKRTKRATEKKEKELSQDEIGVRGVRGVSKVVGKDLFKPSQCSPKKNPLGFTCLDEDTLRMMGEKVSKLSGIDIDFKNPNLRQLYDEVSNIGRSKLNCETEAGLLKLDSVQKKLSPKQKKQLKEEFRTTLPPDVKKDPTAWLSNFDIDGVMKQIEAEYPEFEYYEATPIDFDKCSVNNDLCKLTLKDLQKDKKSKAGIIFNTDDSSGSGKHWIALYVDMNGLNLDGNPGLYYIDSFANSVPEQIQELIKRFEGEATEVLGKEVIVAKNTKSFQRNNYACGYYCMHFIEHMVKGLSFDKYKALPPTDAVMKEYSQTCFIHPDEMK